MPNYFSILFFFLVHHLTSVVCQTETVYETIDLAFPLSIFPIDLQAGDTLYINLTWYKIVDLDIYVYKDGQDLLSTSTYLQRGYGTVDYWENVTYTATLTKRYYVRIRCYTYGD